MSTEEARKLPAGSGFILGVVIFAFVSTLAYWVVWFGVDRELLASAHTPAYYAFENSFPAADAWMMFTSAAAAVAIKRRRASALLWCLTGGACSIYLGLLDVLFDLENGIYQTGDTGGLVVEVLINLLTLSLGAVVLGWAWNKRRELASLDGW